MYGVQETALCVSGIFCDYLTLTSYYNERTLFPGDFIMKRTSPLQKYAAQFSYEHKNMGSHFSGIRKHANELSKTLDNMFPKEKKEKKD